MAIGSNQLSELLEAWAQGDQRALDELVPLVQPELRRLARRYMSRERAGHTLQTTALVNEAYVRLMDQPKVQWHNRAHFFAVAAHLMRHILVDYARRRARAKRGGDGRQTNLDEGAVISKDRNPELLALDEALGRLAALDPRQSRVVVLRYFGGLTIEETAEVLKVSPMTVRRDWRLAKAWLYKALLSDE